MNLLAAPGVRLEARFARTLTGPPDELALLCRPSLYEVGYRYRTTWQGPGSPCGEDWYAASFPQPVWVDTVGFAHGGLFTDGGWWRSFDVEVKRGDGAWQPVTGLRVTPTYDFADTFWEKQPFQPYAVQFDPVQVTALRLIGESGGGMATSPWPGWARSTRATPAARRPGWNPCRRRVCSSCWSRRACGTSCAISRLSRSWACSLSRRSTRATTGRALSSISTRRGGASTPRRPPITPRRRAS
ncbi:MAG: hypothetical protein M5R40_19195 [Anaerolineae bacterium]|nr:hypothetical protein [Anaerolineae bacterium]